MAKAVKICLAGEGGQGVQSVAQILAEAANNAGREVLYIPNFGVEQRGGVSIAFLQIADNSIGAPKFDTADILVTLSDRAVRRCKQYVGPDTVYVYDSSIQGVDDALPKAEEAKKVLPIPALEISKNDLHPRVFNILIMGAVIGATQVIEPDAAKKAIEKKLGYKFEQNPTLRELNFKAIERGMELMK